MSPRPLVPLLLLFLSLGASGEDLVFDNTNTDSASGYAIGLALGIVDAIELTWSRLDVPAPVKVTGFTFSYGTSSNTPVDVMLRIHEGSTGQGVAGTCREFLLEDLPGSDSGGFQLRTMSVELGGMSVPKGLSGDPFVLHPGPIGLSFRVFDLLTGPGLADPPYVTGTGPLVDRYDADGDYLFSFVPFGTLPTAFVFSLTAQDAEFTSSPAAGRFATRRTAVTGRLSGSELDVVRWHGLAGDRLSAAVRRTDKTSGLAPFLTLVDATTGTVLASSKPGAKKALIKRAELPHTGVYELRISGQDGSTGGWELRARSKPPREARRPLQPLSDTGSGPLALFPAAPGAHLTATIRPAKPVDSNVGPPKIVGPDGPLDLTGSILKDGNTYRIEDLVIPALGAWEIRPGQTSVGVDVPFTVKARVRPFPPKQPRNTLTDRDLSVAGRWVREGFVTATHRSELILDPDRSSGASRLVVVDGTVTTVHPIPSWSVQYDPLLPSGGVLRYDRQDGVTGSVEEVVEVFEFPQDDPYRLRIVGSDVIWMRSNTFAPQAPDVQAWVTPEAGDLGLPATLPALSIGCAPGIAAFEIYRAAPGGERPDTPYDRLPATCTGFDSGTTLWVDDTPAGAFRYWARAITADGQRSPSSAPVDFLMGT